MIICQVQLPKNKPVSDSQEHTKLPRRCNPSGIPPISQLCLAGCTFPILINLPIHRFSTSHGQFVCCWRVIRACSQVSGGSSLALAFGKGEGCCCSWHICRMSLQWRTPVCGSAGPGWPGWVLVAGCTVLCCAVLFCSVLCFSVLFYSVLCYVFLCCSVLCCGVFLCCSVLCFSALCCAVLCCAGRGCPAPPGSFGTCQPALGGSREQHTLWFSVPHPHRQAVPAQAFIPGRPTAPAAVWRRQQAGALVSFQFYPWPHIWVFKQGFQSWADAPFCVLQTLLLPQRPSSSLHGGQKSNCCLIKPFCHDWLYPEWNRAPTSVKRAPFPCYLGRLEKFSKQMAVSWQAQLQLWSSLALGREAGGLGLTIL